MPWLRLAGVRTSCANNCGDFRYVVNHDCGTLNVQIRTSAPDQLVSSTPAGAWLVVAAAFGIVFLATGIGVFSFGAFTLSWTQRDWTRGQVAYGQTFFLSAYLLSPIYGRILDRFGASRLIVPAAIAMSASLLLLGWWTEELWQFYTYHFLMGLGAAGIGGVAPPSVVTRWFDNRRRGLALGITQAGAGAGGLVMPVATSWLLQNGSLATAYTLLGLTVAVVAVPIGVRFFRFPDSSSVLVVSGSESASQHRSAGSGMKVAIRSKIFWLLVAAIFLSSLQVNALIIHAIPMLRDLGLSATQAARLAGLIGASFMLGRLVCGYLLDKLKTGVVAAGFYFGVAVGIALLLAFGRQYWPLPVFLLAAGMGAGSEADIVPYVAARYFDIKWHGEIYGWLYTVYISAVMIGSATMAFLFDQTGAYTTALWLFLITSSIAAGIMLTVDSKPRVRVSESR